MMKKLGFLSLAFWALCLTANARSVGDPPQEAPFQPANAPGIAQSSADGDAKTVLVIERYADFITVSPDHKLLFAAYAKRKYARKMEYGDRNYGSGKLDQGSIQVWKTDAPTSELKWLWKCATYYPIQMAVSPDGKLLAVSCTDRKTRLWQIEDSKFLRTINLPVWGTVEFSPDGQTLAVGGIDTTSKRNPKLYVISESDAGLIQLIDTHTWKLKRRFATPDVFATRFSPDGHLLAIASLWNFPMSGFGHDGHSSVGFTVIYDADTGKRVAETPKDYQFEERNGAFSFSPESDTLLIGKYFPDWWQWAEKTGDAPKSSVEATLKMRFGSERDRYESHSDSYSKSFVDFSPDGKIIAAAIGMAINTYDGQSGAPQKRLKLPRKTAFLSFARDSKSLLCFDVDGVVRSWPVR